MSVSNYQRGIQLFNDAQFFAAHEVLEDVWRAAPEPQRKFLQGLIQLAVAFHHHSTGNIVGARSLLNRAMRNLAGYPQLFGGIHLSNLLQAVAEWQRALTEDTPLPPPPHVEVIEC